MRHGERLTPQVLEAAKELDLAIEPTGAYTVRVSNSAVAAEVEVCRLRRFSKVHGLRFKRLVGTSEDYKSLCKELLSKIHM